MHRLLFSFVAIGMALSFGCGGVVDEPAKETEEETEEKIIAENCTGPTCFEADIRAVLECQTFGEPDDYSWEIHMGLQGVVVNQGGCVTYTDGNGRYDLNCHLYSLGEERLTKDTYFRFRLKDYKGPGVYSLAVEDDLGNVGLGFDVRGGVDHPNHSTGYAGATAGVCGQPCVAVVSDRSEPVFESGQLFRFEVDISCPNGPMVVSSPPSCSRGYECSPKAGSVFHIEVLSRS